MSNDPGATPGATPATPPSSTPPVTPPASAPVIPAPAPAAPQGDGTQQPEEVKISKARLEQLERDAARASANQSKADRFDRLNKTGHFKPQAPAAPKSEEEKAATASEEDSKARNGLIALAVDPSYRDLLDSDPTLRQLLTQNPLALLPVYANEAIDAEDAIAMVKEAFDKRIEDLRKSKQPQPPTPPAGTPPAAPPAGAVNAAPPASDEYVAAQKNPNTERAIAGMVGARIKASKK